MKQLGFQTSWYRTIMRMNGGGSGAVVVMVRYDVRRLVSVRPTRGGSRKWNSVCQSRVVVLLLEAVEVREEFGLATTTIGKYGRVVRNGLLARACLRAVRYVTRAGYYLLPNNITLHTIRAR